MNLTPDALFGLANPFALAAWILLLVAPRHRFTEKWVLSGRWSLALSAAYLTLIVANLDRMDLRAFNSLSGVSTLFANPWFLLAGWIHYLAFDLWIGCWEVREAARVRVSRAALGVCLALTFLLGPIGWLAFNGAKGLRRK